MSSAQTVLVIVGLVIGLVVLGVVIYLLNDVLAPLRRISADVTEANKAPMLTKGIHGADQLSTTRRLADSVPPLAVAYLNKLGLSGGAPPPKPFAQPPPAPPPPPSAAPSAAPAPAAAASSQPAWKLFQGG